MKNRRALKIFLSFICFFFPIAAIVCIAIWVFSGIQGLGEDNYALTIVLLLGLCVAFALLGMLIEFLRHRLQVERRVEEILQGTERMAQGDFSVRFTIQHEWGFYDDFDRIKENLNSLSKELSATELLHSDFVSAVSHEIKTPLAVIKGHAERLALGTKDEESMKRHAAALVEATGRLNALVMNILKLNKLENGELPAESKTFDAGAALIECVLSLEDLIDKKNLNLEVDVEEGVMLSASDGYFEILCNNLLSNAVKFTDAGGNIRVGLHADGNMLVATFADSGCGISQKDGDRIFDKFYQADTSRKSEGNGLGLALVKKVIQRIGGEISVESEVGKGSTFTVRLMRSV